MNIVFICDEYPPGKTGGIGTMVQVLSRELVKQGHHVFVLGLYAYSYGEKDFEEDKGVKVWRFRYGLNFGKRPAPLLDKIFNKIPDFIKRHLNGIKAFKKFTGFLNQLITKEKIDVIEIPDWNTFAMRIGFQVKWPPFKVPLVLKSHGSYTKIWNDLGKKPKEKLLQIDRLLYDRADALAAVSRDTADVNKNLFGIKRDIEVLYNGIEPNLAASNGEREKNKVIYAGTLIEAKGIYQLLKAWNGVHRSDPSAIVEVYGKGDAGPLKKLLDHGALESVIFKGHISRPDLLKVFSTATLAVFPSYSETFGLAALEAMNMGCPVIFTKRSSGPEIIHDRINGELVEPDNVKEITDAVVKLLKDPDTRKSYSQKGSETVTNKFSIQRSATEHIAYYKKVIVEFNKVHR